jgi:hypothetical protein
MSAWKCDRCGKMPSGYDLWDYCCSCSKHLCSACMGDGLLRKLFPPCQGSHGILRKQMTQIDGSGRNWA